MSGLVSRQSSTSDESDYVILDQQNMLSEERLRTERSLKNIFQRIALFRYDDAKAAVDQAFDSTSKQSGSTSGGGTALGPLKPVILLLIEEERKYVQTEVRKKKSQFSLKNIASIGQTITTRSTPNTIDRLKAGLQAIASDAVSGNDVTALVRTVASELDCYVNARFTRLHDQVLTEYCQDPEKAVKTEFCKDSLNHLQMVKTMATNIKSDALIPLKLMLEYETSVTEQLFSCSLALAQWDFVGSLLHLHNFDQTYKDFIDTFKGKEKSLVVKRTVKDDEFPELYKWFFKVYESLLSKYSLYFCKTLLQDSHRRALRGNSSTTTITDYRARLIDFYKKTRAASITILLNVANLDRPFLGHGCKLFSLHPERDLSSSYTAKFEEIFHYQGKEKDERLDDDVKKEIVHLFSDVFHKNGKPYLYDAGRNRSYFLLLFDVHIFLAVSYNSLKREKDSEIDKFFEDFKNSMNLRDRKSVV